MADHHHIPGSMDISEHEKTYNGFVKLTTRSAIAIVVGLILLALVNA